MMTTDSVDYSSVNRPLVISNHIFSNPSQNIIENWSNSWSKKSKELYLPHMSLAFLSLLSQMSHYLMISAWYRCGAFSSFVYPKELQEISEFLDSLLDTLKRWDFVFYFHLGSIYFLWTTHQSYALFICTTCLPPSTEMKNSSSRMKVAFWVGVDNRLRDCVCQGRQP